MTVVDLFSGCGGMSLGFQNAGFEIKAAYENWQPAIEVYRVNFKHPVHCLDLSCEVEASTHIKNYSPDIIIGGPPCQDFSIAGSRKEEKRANLTISFARIVASVLPNIVIMENVYNIEKSKFLVSAVQILKESGYGITTKIIDASLVGVPQKRKRFFLIGKLATPDGYFETALDSGLAKKSMTMRDYFQNSLDLEFYYAHPRSYNRRGIFSIDEPSSTIRRVNRPIPRNYVKHPADKAEVSDHVRPLSTEERSQVQTFPKYFKFVGSKTDQEQMIGNAVPVKLAEYVAKCLRNSFTCSYEQQALAG